MSRIAYIMNSGRTSGVGRQAFEVLDGIRTFKEEVQPVPFLIDGSQGKTYRGDQVVDSLQSWPGIFGSKSIQWIRLGKRLVRQLRSSEDIQNFGLFHLTNQSLSFLTAKLHPSVITVHDIIELTDPQDSKASWLHWYLSSGIPKADHIIAVSEHTKREVVSYFSIPEEKITVIHNGVSTAFAPLLNFKRSVGYQQFLQYHKLSAQAGPIILFVGSDHPRKNVSVALQVFAQVKKLYPGAVFLKVGTAGIAQGRQETLHMIEKLRIADSVRFIEQIDHTQLQELYNMADIFLFPSRNEGFGLPPLEAMACGTPVVCSNAASLPEVVGDAALMYEPDDVEGMTNGIRKILDDPALHQSLMVKGRLRAKEFSWQAAAEKTMGVYKTLL